MNRIREKLSGSSGATFVFAIVIFLVSVIFSTIMVDGALSGAKNSKLLQEQEQSYLAGRSAAKLLTSYLASDDSNDRYVEMVEIIPGDTSGLPDEGIAAVGTAISDLQDELGFKSLTNFSDSTLTDYRIACKDLTTGAETFKMYSENPLDLPALSGDDSFLYAACMLLVSTTSTPEIELAPVTADETLKNALESKITLEIDDATKNLTAKVRVKSDPDTVVYQSDIVYKCQVTSESDSEQVSYTYQIVTGTDDEGHDITTNITGFHTIQIKHTLYHWEPKSAELG